MRPEFLFRRREVLARSPRPELGVGDRRAVAEGEPEVHPGFRRPVQFVGRDVVAEPVAAVVGEPEVPGLRVPVEPYRIPDAPGVGLEIGPVRVHPEDGAEPLVVGVADVAGHTYRNVEFPVGSERDEFPPVQCFIGKCVAHHLRFGRVREVRLDIVVTQDAADLGDVKRTVPEGDAVRGVETACDGDHLIASSVAIAVGDGVDVSGITTSDEERPVWGDRHRPRPGDVPGINIDGKPRREGDRIERQGAAGAAGRHHDGHDDAKEAKHCNGSKNNDDPACHLESSPGLRMTGVDIAVTHGGPPPWSLMFVQALGRARGGPNGCVGLSILQEEPPMSPTGIGDRP